MKILMIQSPFMGINLGGTNYGGVETYVNTFTKWLLDHDYEVTVVAPDDSTNVTNAKLVTVGSVSKWALDKTKSDPTKKIRFNYSLYSNTIRELGINNYDLVISNSDKTTLNSFLNSECNRLGVKNVIVYMHNAPVFRGSPDTAKSFNKLTNLKFQFNSHYNYKAWMTIADANNLVHFKQNSTINMLACDDNHVNQATTISPYNFVMIARFVENKGIETMKSLAIKYPKLNCHIIGNIDKQEYFDKIVANKPDNLHIHTGLTKEQNSKLILELSGYMCSFSKFETFGITPIESIEHGLPFICINYGTTNVPYFNKNRVKSEDECILISDIGITIKKTKNCLPDIFDATRLSGNFNNKIIRKVWEDEFRINDRHLANYIHQLTQ